MSRALVEAVAARIESQVGAARTVYRLAVPGSPAPRYIVVRSSVGEDDTADLGDALRLRSPLVTVTSVARGATGDAPSPDEAAANSCMWGMEKAHAALVGWRPTIGQAAWRPGLVASLEPSRDESLPETVYFAVERWGFQYQP